MPKIQSHPNALKESLLHLTEVADKLELMGSMRTEVKHTLRKLSLTSPAFVTQRRQTMMYQINCLAGISGIELLRSHVMMMLSEIKDELHEFDIHNRNIRISSVGGSDDDPGGTDQDSVGQSDSVGADRRHRL